MMTTIELIRVKILNYARVGYFNTRNMHLIEAAEEMAVATEDFLEIKEMLEMFRAVDQIDEPTRKKFFITAMMVRDEILAELAGIVIRDYEEKWGK